jgi:hypothetical protein
MTRIALILVAAAIAASLGAGIAAAQCRPPADSHEARLLAFYEAPIAFSMAGAPERASPGSIRLGAEAVPVPTPRPELQHPSYCYQYTTNNTRLAALFGRPRLTVGLPGALALEASYLPPITVGAARATIASVALARTQEAPFSGGQLDVTLRLHATAGAVHGAITCPRGSLQLTDEAAPCYGTDPSRDTFHPTAYGGEIAIRTHDPGSRIAAYGGAGLSALRPSFRAGFTDALGHVDNTTVDVALTRATLFAGAAVRARPNFALMAQIYAVPADVTTIRVGAEYRIR